MKKKIVNEIFIERCNSLKNEKGFSLDAIEKDIGVSKGMMSKYMSGDHLPNSEVIRKLSGYWGVSADYLLGSSDDRNNNTVDSNSIPAGYANIIKDAIKEGITEDEFRELFEMAKKFKNLNRRGDSY